MRPGARTPEELETLLEDAFLVGDSEALAELFERSAVIASANGGDETRGREQIARFVTRLWDRERLYVGDARRIVQARNTALVIASRGINVARRGDDGAWRYGISLLETEHRDERNRT